MAYATFKIVTMSDIRDKVLRSTTITEFQRRVYLALLDGRAGMVAAFDGISDHDRPATQLNLCSAEVLGQTVWLRYEVKE